MQRETLSFVGLQSSTSYDVTLSYRHYPQKFENAYLACVAIKLFRTRKRCAGLQGRRRLLESGKAIEHRWCPPSADCTRGRRTRGLADPARSRKGGGGGGLGDLPQENFVIQDD